MMLILFGSGGAIHPAAGVEGTHCTFAFNIVLDPGLSLEPTSGRHFSEAPGTLECDGPVNGREPTGTGTLTEDGPYGTLDPDSCQSGGEGSGTDRLSIPTADGLQEIVSEFTVTFGRLSNKNAVFGGEFSGTRFTGSFRFTPIEGDCVTSPVTKVALEGEGVIHG